MSAKGCVKVRIQGDGEGKWVDCPLEKSMDKMLASISRCLKIPRNTNICQLLLGGAPINSMTGVRNSSKLTVVLDGNSDDSNQEKGEQKPRQKRFLICDQESSDGNPPESPPKQTPPQKATSSPKAPSRTTTSPQNRKQKTRLQETDPEPEPQPKERSNKGSSWSNNKANAAPGQKTPPPKEKEVPEENSRSEPQNESPVPKSPEKSQMSRVQDPKEVIDDFQEKAEFISNQFRANIRSSYQRIFDLPNDFPPNFKEYVTQTLKKAIILPDRMTSFGTDSPHQFKEFLTLTSIFPTFAIIGPRHSGKSTLFKAISQKTLESLIMTGQIADTFFYYLDTKAIKNVDDPKKFTAYIINHTIDQLAVQYPLLTANNSQAAKALKDFFKTIMANSKFSPLGIPFNRVEVLETALLPIEALGNQILASSDNDLYALATQLPHAIAACFGFRRVVYAIDSFDILQSVKLPQKNLFNLFATRISSQYFIVSFEDEQRFYREKVLENATLVQTVNACQAPEGKSLVVNLENYSTPLTIGYKDCMGCSAFITELDGILKSDLNQIRPTARVKLMLRIQDFLQCLIEPASAEDGTEPKEFRFESFEIVDA